MKKQYNGLNEFYSNVFQLLEKCFPGITAAADTINKFNAPWHQTSIPFVTEKNQQVISHLGLIPLRLILNGRYCNIAGFHAICTDPEYRMKGHSRKLFEEAMTYAQQLFDGVILFTDKPFLYERYQFKTVEQYNFELNYEKGITSSNLLSLDMNDKHHVGLVQNYCQNRLPVSTIFGDIPTKPLYTINCLDKNAYYSSEHQFIVLYRVVKQTLYLQDILYIHQIELDLILKSIPENFSKVVFEFIPSIVPSETLVPVKIEIDEKLMFSGTFPYTGTNIRCPEMIRF